MKLPFIAVLILTTTVTVGCTSGTTMERGPRPSFNVITNEQVQFARRTNALEVVETMQPKWLRNRGTDPFGAQDPPAVQVYVNGGRMGGPEVLRVISATTVNSMIFLDGRQATERFGLRHQGGAILIMTHSELAFR